MTEVIGALCSAPQKIVMLVFSCLAMGSRTYLQAPK